MLLGSLATKIQEKLRHHHYCTQRLENISVDSMDLKLYHTTALGK